MPPLLLFLVWLAAAPAASGSGLYARTDTEGGFRTAAPAPDTIVAATLRNLAETAQHPYLTWPDYPGYQDEMKALYEPGGYRLLWLDEDGEPSGQAGDVVEALFGARAHGLNPDDYDAERLAGLLDEAADDREFDDSELAPIDGAISIGFLRYLSDIHIGRVNPANMHFGFNVEPKKLDLAETVREAIERDRVGETVAAVEPGFPQYVRVKNLLAPQHADLRAGGPDRAGTRATALAAGRR